MHRATDLLLLITIHSGPPTSSLRRPPQNIRPSSSQTTQSLRQANMTTCLTDHPRPQLSRMPDCFGCVKYSDAFTYPLTYLMLSSTSAVNTYAVFPGIASHCPRVSDRQPSHVPGLVTCRPSSILYVNDRQSTTFFKSDGRLSTSYVHRCDEFALSAPDTLIVTYTCRLQILNLLRRVTIDSSLRSRILNLKLGCLASKHAPWRQKRRSRLAPPKQSHRLSDNTSFRPLIYQTN